MAVTRVILFVTDPYEEQPGLGPGVCSTISFQNLPDANTTGRCFTCAYYPPGRMSGISIAQEKVFLGTNAPHGKTYRTMDHSLQLDDGTTIRREFISARLDPDRRADSQQGRDSTTKLFEFLTIDGTSLVDEGNGTLYWTKDVDPIRSPSVSWTLFGHTIGVNNTSFYFENGLANWIHIRGVNSSVATDPHELSNFTLDYRDAGRGREGIDS